MQPIRTLLAALLLASCALPAAAQTIRTLGYNSTNGVIVAATNVTWSNSFNFTTNTVAATIRANLGFSTNLNTLWTATNQGIAASSIGLGTADNVNFNSAYLGFLSLNENGNGLYFADYSISIQTNGISFSTNAAAGTRSNLSLGLPALTNTSNVAMMRALGGTTFSNEPYSGSIQFLDWATNDMAMYISNGIILNVTDP